MCKEKEPKRNTKCSIPPEVDEFLDHVFDYLLDIVKEERDMRKKFDESFNDNLKTKDLYNNLLSNQDWLDACTKQFEDDLQDILFEETGDETAKVSHYLHSEGTTYIWYSTSSHPKTDLVLAVDYL